MYNIQEPQAQSLLVLNQLLWWFDKAELNI